VAGSSYISDCNKCHANKDIPTACLKCHTEIKAELTEFRGYHHELLAGKKIECARCHSEHNGREFQLINKTSWGGKDPKNFKHSFTTFKLVGKHEKLDCKECHEKKAKPFALAEFPTHMRKSTYLGLKQTCTACHKDIHAGGLASDCESCHGQDSWKPTPFFDHEKFFSLKLKHAGIDCKKCHVIPALSAPIPVPRPKGFPFNKAHSAKATQCSDCHKNPHKTNWREDCETCHTRFAIPWSDAVKNMPRALHAQTRFRLVSPHNKVTCVQCHDPKKSFVQRYENSKTHRAREEKSCELCHKDQHRGQFVAKHPQCIECHALSGFLPGKFGVAEHKRSAYPLVGKHMAAKCNSCHVKDASTGARIYIGVKQNCSNCHADAHYGQFRAGGATKTQCEACHVNPAGFKKLIFNHDTARFKLDDSHRTVACKDCHPTVSLPDGKKTVQYKPLRMKCEDCHDFR
jgi:hypothetical protein